MEKLKKAIENQLKNVEKLYDYYLDKYDENQDGKYFERRINELRVEKRTLENIIDMIENPESFEVIDRKLLKEELIK